MANKLFDNSVFSAKQQNYQNNMNIFKKSLKYLCPAYISVVLQLEKEKKTKKFNSRGMWSHIKHYRTAVHNFLDRLVHSFQPHRSLCPFESAFLQRALGINPAVKCQLIH